MSLVGRSAGVEAPQVERLHANWWWQWRRPAAPGWAEWHCIMVAAPVGAPYTTAPNKSSKVGNKNTIVTLPIRPSGGGATFCIYSACLFAGHPACRLRLLASWSRRPLDARALRTGRPPSGPQLAGWCPEEWTISRPFPSLAARIPAGRKQAPANGHREAPAGGLTQGDQLLQRLEARWPTGGPCERVCV